MRSLIARDTRGAKRKNRLRFAVLPALLLGLAFLLVPGILAEAPPEGQIQLELEGTELPEFEWSGDIFEASEVKDIFLVGVDIMPGIYQVVVRDQFIRMGYVARGSAAAMELSDILASATFTGDGYVEVLPSDVAVRTQGVDLVPLDVNSQPGQMKTTLTDGIYLVGHDLQPGVYKVRLASSFSGMGHVARLKGLSMAAEDIIFQEILERDGSLLVLESDLAISISQVSLEYEGPKAP